MNALVLTKKWFLLGVFVKICYAENRVAANQEFPFCDKQWKDFGKEMAKWRERCIEKGPQFITQIKPGCSQYYLEEKKYFKQRVVQHKEMCFVEGPYPEPYLLANTGNGMLAIDLTTLDTTLIKLNYHSYEFDTDMIERKMYFHDGGDICKANFDGTDKNIVVKGDGSVRDIAIDWIKRGLFWCTRWAIYISDLEGKQKRLLVRFHYASYPRIALDPILGLRINGGLPTKELSRGVKVLESNLQTMPIFHNDYAQFLNTHCVFLN